MARLFVTTYGLYNEGRQFESNETGFWFDVVVMDYEELIDHFKDNELDEDPELMFTDFEDFPRDLYSESMSPSEYDALDSYARLSDDDQLGYQFLLDRGFSPDDCQLRCDEVCFSDQSAKDYAYDYVEECYSVEPWIMGHIDFESVARELEMDGIIEEWGNYLVINANDF